MRHSFLPTTEQRALKGTYHVHALVVALFLLAVVGTVAIGTVFPAYIEVATEERGQASRAAGASGDQKEVARMNSELKIDTALIQSLLGSVSAHKPSELITDIVSARGSIRILSISLSDISTTTATSVIQGVAPTRESLVSFKSRLENMAAGNKVELPISELAKSKDIQFSFRFTRILP